MPKFHLLCHFDFGHKTAKLPVKQLGKASMLDQNNNHDVGIQNVITSCDLVVNQNNFNISTKWILTIVYIVALILTGCSTDNIEAKTINIRVANEQSNEAISNAEVLLILEGSAPLTSYTDSQGFVIFELKETDQQRFTVVVTANGYQSYQRNLLGSGSLFEIRLAEQLEGVSNFLLRVIDNTTTRSVSNINATIVVDGKSYTDPTDDSGIVQFSMSIEEHSVSAIVII
ncbi:MAG: hypothetical protein KDE51_08435, partial [Anaerolineales bacterium]|nr:hypothetical protein [Anaerolineales bacterium]